MPTNRPKMPKDGYVAVGMEGHCRMCGKLSDLRCGSCWNCAVHVAGEMVSPGVHRLWDSRNPSNTWLVGLAN